MKIDENINKFKNRYFTLTNKYFFWSIFILIVGVLTWINNYGFYSHIERTTVGEIQQLEKVLLTIIDEQSNKSQEEMQKYILNSIKEWNFKAHYILGIQIRLLDGSISDLKSNRNWDTSSGARFEVDIEKLLKKENKAIEIYSVNNQVLSSVVKSMTFSVMDIKNDIFNEIKAPINGKVLIKAKEIDKDLISIYHNNNNQTKIDRKYISIEDEYGISKNIYLKEYSNILVKEGFIIKKDDIIATGSIHTALDRVTNIYWYRSRITICFAIFMYFILWLSRKRTHRLKELEEKEEDRLKKIYEIEASNISQAHKETLTAKVKNKIHEFDAILNPPINYLNFNELLENNLDIIGTKFRKVSEKIIFQVYENHIGKLPYRCSLSQAVYELNKSGIISDTAQSYLTIVRVYGNISSHYNDSVNISKEEAILVASALMNVIEEIYDKKLLNTI